MECCIHEKRWGEIETMLKALNKEVFGDGSGKSPIRHEIIELKGQIKGLTEIVIKREGHIDSIFKDINGIKTSLSAMLKADADMQEWKEKHEAELKEKAKEDKADRERQIDLRDKKQNRTMYVIVILIAAINLATLLFTL